MIFTHISKPERKWPSSFDLFSNTFFKSKTTCAKTILVETKNECC